jgi:hypothetical protein
MLVNAGRPRQWKKDIAASVDFFNAWFMEFAPAAYQQTRVQATESVLHAFAITFDLREIRADTLRDHPEVIATLRMSTCPPLAQGRLAGLAYVNKTLIAKMETGRLPPRMLATALHEYLERMSDILQRLSDRDLLPWLAEKAGPNAADRLRAATVIADRLCGSVADPIIRNAQERRQLSLIGQFLEARGYRRKAPTGGAPLNRMDAGTFAFRVNLPVGGKRQVNIPVDVVVQPKRRRRSGFPILIEAKSAGDFTNVNKRRKEEATKMRQLRDAYGTNISYVLFLCGYFDTGYLGYEAAEGIDWVWEHRIDDLLRLGI